MLDEKFAKNCHVQGAAYAFCIACRNTMALGSMVVPGVVLGNSLALLPCIEWIFHL
jgi:hypothetical protein